MQANRTRFAPSPNGPLHLGHVVHMIWTWGAAQINQSQIVGRLEDHDESRCKDSIGPEILQDMNWLGFKVSSEITKQSDRRKRYADVAQALLDQGLVYACVCYKRNTKREENLGTKEFCYPGTCRTKCVPLDTKNATWRLKMPNRAFKFQDLIHGVLTQNPSEQCGDVVIRDRNHFWTYQFCVVIDDLDQGIDLIVRGEDLLSSVGRQLALREICLRTNLAKSAPEPIFVHHPLLRDKEGQKLSKRIGSQAISEYRIQGWSPAQVLRHGALLANLPIDDTLPNADKCYSVLPIQTLNVKNLSQRTDREGIRTS